MRLGSIERKTRRQEGTSAKFHSHEATLTKPLMLNNSKIRPIVLRLLMIIHDDLHTSFSLTERNIGSSRFFGGFSNAAVIHLLSPTPIRRLTRLVRETLSYSTNYVEMADVRVWPRRALRTTLKGEEELDDVLLVNSTLYFGSRWAVPPAPIPSLCRQYTFQPGTMPSLVFKEKQVATEFSADTSQTSPTNVEFSLLHEIC